MLRVDAQIAARNLAAHTRRNAFLAAARDSRWQFEGLDVNHDVNEFARSLGFTAHEGDLESFRPDRVFDAVAIWNTFYQLPEETAFDNWRRSTPHRFLFAVKGSRFITHMIKLKDPERGLSNFMPRAERLRWKLGPVLWQLPPGWKVNVERLEAFPFLPLEVTAKTTQKILKRPEVGSPSIGREFKQGEKATIMEYYPSGPNVWGKLRDGGWIALLLHLEYPTSWSMETAPPP